MRIRPALLSALFVVSAGLPLATAEAMDFTTTGTVVSTGRDSIVVRIDDHGHKIPFAIAAPTVLPAGVTAGSRVSVTYRPTGPTGQEAYAVTLLAPAPAARRSKAPAAAPAAPKPAEQPNS